VSEEEARSTQDDPAPPQTEHRAKAWWESPAFRAAEAIAVVVAIVGGIGGLYVSAQTYRAEQERARAESAAAVVLLPGTEDVRLQNFGSLPVLNVSIHIGDLKDVMLGVLPPCHEVDVSPYGTLREIRDRDGDGVGESEEKTIIQFWDANGILWHRTGSFGYSKTFSTALSPPEQSDTIIGAGVPSPPARPRRMEGC
jgi:hypothetical protein